MKAKSLLVAALLSGAALFATAGPSIAADVELLPPGLLAPAPTDMVPAGKFKKAPPWVIGMSWPGVGNTWIVQTIQEIKAAGSHDPDIKEFRFSEANWQPAKQVADIEDLMTHKVDALIIVPISPDLVKAQVQAATAAGIPVVMFTTAGIPFPDATVSVYGGGASFGKTGGDFLKDKLHGKGTIWAFRGIAGSGEETARYNGLKEALKGSDVKIGAEVYGDWNYAKAKQLCENLVASGQPVDGIWFSGADMTRACFDVFKEIGKPLVPMTGEANNGFLRAWKAAGADSVGPIYTPGLGPATVRAAVALLKGEPVYKAYSSDPAPITGANFDKYYRPDLNDAYWFPSTLPEDVIKQDFKK
jgi:ribose transport system substrate-binding protein